MMTFTDYYKTYILRLTFKEELLSGITILLYVIYQVAA